MEFIWNDGGRAACGFVGAAGDCVTRAIAISTGRVYREIYDEIGSEAGRTARNGVDSHIVSAYLSRNGWKNVRPTMLLQREDLPPGVVILLFANSSGHSRRLLHLSCAIDRTVHDTWNPFEDGDYLVRSYWVHSVASDSSSMPIIAPGTAAKSTDDQLSQKEYEKILARVTALHRTASNAASTEGEVRTALRMLQTMMLKHNLSRSDITEDDNTDHVGMTRRACPLNRNRAYQWESALAYYIVEEVFPMVQFYQDRNGHRTFFWFYGPHEDVEQTIGLFRELLLTIATSARVQYGGFTRGSGASYAEGYVRGLPKSYQWNSDNASPVSEGAIIHARTLAVQSAARAWLDEECGIRLHSTGGSSRRNFDPAAHSRGKKDGAKHTVNSAYARPRITER